MAKSTTGFSEAKVNDLISTFNSDSKKVLNEVKDEFQAVIQAMADNWGTTDGVKWVGETFIPSLNKTGQQIADAIVEIGKTINTTAQQQAADTHNKVTITAATKASMGTLTNKMKDKLDNGFVGVYDDLKTKVAKAHQNLVTNVDKKLNTLQQHVVDKAGKAFLDSGKASKVQGQVQTYVGEIKKAIDDRFKTLNQEIDANTAAADKYAHDIQGAGLRSGGSN